MENTEVDVKELLTNETVRQEKSRTEGTKTRKGKRHLKAPIGLIIYTPRSTGWPKEPLTRSRLIKGIEDKKYMWSYTDTVTDDNKILGLINNNAINLENCFDISEAGNFRKLRTGLIQERFPLQRTERLRKTSNKTQLETTLPTYVMPQDG